MVALRKDIPPSAAWVPRSSLAAIFFPGLSLNRMSRQNKYMFGTSLWRFIKLSALATHFCAVHFVLLLLFTLPAQAALHVLIDPGHGGSDRGAVRGKLREAEIALKVSLLLAEHLRRDSRFRVSLTRTSDENVGLKERVRIAKDRQADLFLSIHLNSSRSRLAEGKEFYFQNQMPADEESMFLAAQENQESASLGEDDNKGDTLSTASDLKRIIEDLRRNQRIHSSSELSQILHEQWTDSHPERNVGSRSIRQAPFYVVVNVPAPSVLVELGFLTHPVEGPRLAKADYQQELARSLYEGLVKYKERIDKD